MDEFKPVPTDEVKLVKKTCEVCGRNVDYLEEHHWTYQPPYSEHYKIKVCRKCHLLADAFRRICEADTDRLLKVWKSMPDPLKDRFNAVVGKWAGKK